MINTLIWIDKLLNLTAIFQKLVGYEVDEKYGVFHVGRKKNSNNAHKNIP